MTLDEWLRTESMSDAEFARQSGVRHKQLVGKYRKGKQIPSRRNMRLIREATGGAVTANDFFAHPMPVVPSAPTAPR